MNVTVLNDTKISNVEFSVKLGKNQNIKKRILVNQPRENEIENLELFRGKQMCKKLWILCVEPVLDVLLKNQNIRAHGNRCSFA